MRQQGEEFNSMKTGEQIDVGAGGRRGGNLPCQSWNGALLELTSVAIFSDVSQVD